MGNRLLSKLLLLCILVSMLCGVVLCNGALATTCKLKSTQDFIDYLEVKGIKYNVVGMTDDNDEKVTVSYRLDNFASLTCTFFFDQREDRVALRIWDIIKANASQSYICETVNKLNKTYKWCKFVYDYDDSTVQAEMDMFISDTGCGPAIYNAMSLMFAVIDDNDVSSMIHSMER